MPSASIWLLFPGVGPARRPRGRVRAVVDTDGSGTLLWTPLTIGPVRSSNRVVAGAHFTQFTEPAKTAGEPGHYGRRYGRYLAEFARGGAGLVIAGQAQVHPTTAYQMTNNASAWDEGAVPGFCEVTEAIHEHGALAFLQLAHNGGVNTGAWSRLPAWAPSSVANYFEPPKVIETDEIAEVVASFARSAANAAAGGFDGIEVHGAHGYLIHEFLSPRSNLRTDEYGGSLENRMRFVVEVLTAVRTAVGSGTAVGLRLVGDEEQRWGPGLTKVDAAEIGARLAAAGLVDFLDVSVGLSGMGMVRPVYARHLLGVQAAAAVRRAVREVAEVPVFAVHRILTPEEAEGVLARGEADGITLVRALIADPQWPAKARRGEADTIRLCTGCNQSCYGNLTAGLPITCATNPAVGREDELGWGTLAPAERAKRVVVIGGGPSGLEAAWLAAARGHQVTLLERSHTLGGKIRLAQLLPGRAELADFADWRAAECRRRGVDIRLAVDATADDVLALSPDAVIVATGGRATVDGHAKFHPMPVPGSDAPWVLDHEAALINAAQLTGPVVIIDVVGHIEGIGLGELFAASGVEVTLAMPLPSPLLLDSETMAAALPRAVRAGMRWRPNTVMASIGDHEVTLIDTLSLAADTISVETVVVRTHGVPNDGLYFALKADVPEVRRVGDAVAVRPVDRAVFDGHLAGRAL
jgi:2,4-dienoyl-CoA reductase-like NADH-dependent reductase (Old Yellow Enzyme family)